MVKFFQLLREDHDKARTTMKKLVDPQQKSERERLFREFRQDYIAHNYAEERVLYQAMRRHGLSVQSVCEGHIEHELIDSLLGMLGSAVSKGSSEWTAGMHVLKAMLESHLYKEEEALFNRAVKVFTTKETEVMLARFQETKTEVLAIGIASLA